MSSVSSAVDRCCLFVVSSGVKSRYFSYSADIIVYIPSYCFKKIRNIHALGEQSRGRLAATDVRLN